MFWVFVFKIGKPIALIKIKAATIDIDQDANQQSSLRLYYKVIGVVAWCKKFGLSYHIEN